MGACRRIGCGAAGTRQVVEVTRLGDDRVLAVACDEHAEEVRVALIGLGLATERAEVIGGPVAPSEAVRTVARATAGVVLQLAVVLEGLEAVAAALEDEEREARRGDG